jgi:hypothetical protein
MSDYGREIANTTEWLLYHTFIPHSDDWFTVATWVDKWLNGSGRHARDERPNPALVLAAFERLVTTGHLEAGTDDYGARVFRRRKERP